MSPTPLWNETKPAWSMPCSINWRASCARAEFEACRRVHRRARDARPCAAIMDRDFSIHDRCDKSANSGEDRSDRALFQAAGDASRRVRLDRRCGGDLTPPPGCDLVFKTDAIIGGVHFFPTIPRFGGAEGVAGESVGPRRQGRDPARCFLSIGLPAGISEPWLGAFASGLGHDVQHFKCPLLGANTARCRCHHRFSLVIGTVPHGQIVRRAGGRVGDRVVVTERSATRRSVYCSARTAHTRNAGSLTKNPLMS